MKKLTVLTLLTVAGLALAAGGGCTGPAKAPAPIVTTDFAQQLAKNDLVLFWDNQLPLDNQHGELIVKFYRQPKFLYAVTNQNRLICVDAFSGAFKWASTSLGSPGQAVSPVGQLGDKLACIAVLNNLYGFAIDNGQPMLYRELKRAPSTGLILFGEFCYFGTNEGWFDAIHLTKPANSWDRLTGAEILAAPTVDEQQVYFASTDGKVIGSSSKDRQDRWQFPEEAGEHIGAVVADLKRTSSGLVLVASRDYSLYALNASNGQPAWICTTGDPLLKSPHVAGNHVYLLKEDHVLLALDELNGEKPLWKRPGVKEFVSASAAAIYVRNEAGHIVALSPQDGSPLFDLSLQGLEMLPCNEVDGALFAANATGEVIAIREKKGKYEEEKVEVKPEVPVVEVKPVAPKAKPAEGDTTPAEPKVKAEPKPKPEPKAKPEPKPKPEPAPKPEPKAKPAPAPKPAPKKGG